MHSKKIFAVLALIFTASACATMPQEGRVDGIGTILADEIGARLSEADERLMNKQIDKALTQSDIGVTTQWSVGYPVKIRLLEEFGDSSGRTCRRFRHGQKYRDEWETGTGAACRTSLEPWYLVSNRWDRFAEVPRPRNQRVTRYEQRERQRKTWLEIDERMKNLDLDDFGPASKSVGQRGTDNW